ncbi:MAG: GNAT family N-acetyltransferase [Saprospiraceae bacterium]|jgi:predicted acetyltransferase|nr:GNAT family N-acetyltransferase [Saprospiraceae bacterium]MCI1265728.1 GNAT family N-acetyltransferase [Saprospiraceae bacterium]
MLSNITYHRATQSDIHTLVDYRILFALELSGNQDEDLVQFLRKQMTSYFTNATADHSCISFIAQCDGKVAGIGSVHFRQMPGNFKNPSGKWGYIMNMYTISEFRRKGICKHILNLLVAEGRKYGVTAFELHATEAGEKVYIQEGFIQHKEPTLRKILTL